MGGGVHPAEWIIPMVGASHMAYNAAANAADVQGAKVNAPGSANDKANIAQDQEELRQEAARQAEAERQALIPRPQSGADEQASRQRAVAASETLGGSRKRGRASQTLTTSTSTLSGLPREAA